LRRRKGALTIREVEPDYLTTRIAQSIDYIIIRPVKPPSTGKVGRPKKGATPTPKPAPMFEEISVACPRALINQLLAAETLHKFPWLEAIIEAPTLNADGSILSTPGYDPKNALFFDMRSMLKMPSFKTKPDIEDAKHGLEVLKDLLNEFAFADKVSRSVALAAILTALVRTILTIAPVFLIDAPGQSNGKTLLANLIGMISTGRATGAAQWANETAEQRKAIGTILAAGDSVVNFDNITTPIGGPALCSVLTSATFKDRLLGEHTQINLPTFVTWLFTGNGLTIKDDIATRAMRCRLDAKCEFPDQRDFVRKDLLGYAAEHRAELIHAGLTIVQAYILAGKPKPKEGGSKSRFNDWGDIIADALVWCSEPNPTLSREGIIAEDPVRGHRRELLKAWMQKFGNTWATASEIEHSSVGDIIDELEPNGKHVPRIHIWSRLKPFEGQIIDGVLLQKIAGDHNRTAQWRVKPHDTEPPSVYSAAAEDNTGDEFGAGA
jgi:putative DNA primase/helicase